VLFIGGASRQPPELLACQRDQPLEVAFPQFLGARRIAGLEQGDPIGDRSTGGARHGAPPLNVCWSVTGLYCNTHGLPIFLTAPVPYAQKRRPSRQVWLVERVACSDTRDCPRAGASNASPPRTEARAMPE